MRKFKKLKIALPLLLLLLLAVGAMYLLGVFPPLDKPIYADSLSDIPEFSGKAFVYVNGNKPFFTEEEITDSSFENYSPLDGLGRCGAAFASIGRDLMPTEDREGSLSSVTPSGWLNKPYDIVDGGYLYNRAHLIGWQLTAELTTKENLITGTRFMNVEGMLPFENMVAAYIKETENHVMYRVTPIYEGNELVARGVLMEALSVEDEGKGICFCVYIYNNQPGISIDYSTGDSKLDDGVPFPEPDPDDIPETPEGEPDFIINTSTKKYHLSSCRHATGNNVKDYYGTEDDLISDGYVACGVCKP